MARLKYELQNQGVKPSEIDAILKREFGEMEESMDVADNE